MPTEGGSKLETIFYALLKHRRAYDETIIAGSPELQTQKRHQSLEKNAQKLGFTLTPPPTAIP